MIDMKAVGLRILVARRQQGLRQGEVAKLAGISARHMSQIETGKRPGVQAVTMAKIAQVLHVSVDYLLGLTKAEDWEQEERTTTENAGQ